jgi:hypothetical protein
MSPTTPVRLDSMPEPDHRPEVLDTGLAGRPAEADGHERNGVVEVGIARSGVRVGNTLAGRDSRRLSRMAVGTS